MVLNSVLNTFLNRYLAEKAYGPTVACLYRDLLFVANGRAMNAPMFRLAFQRQFYQHAGVHITVAEYRHVVIAFMSKHLKGRVSSLDELLDRQGTHSSQTAGMRYARSTEDHQQLSRETMLQYYHCSEAWHAFLGIGDQACDVIRGQSVCPPESSFAAAVLPMSRLIRSEPQGVFSF